MVLRITTKTSDEGRERVTLELGGLRLNFRDGEVEDNCIGRNFEDVHSIEDMVLAAHKLGKAGQDLIVERVEQ